VRIQLAGRLGGAEMARTESSMAGSIPLSTLRAKVEYGFTEAHTAQGNIGIKVWINNGDYLDPEENSDAANAQAGKGSKKPAGKGEGGERAGQCDAGHASLCASARAGSRGRRRPGNGGIQNSVRSTLRRPQTDY